MLKKLAKAAEDDGLEGIGLSNKHGPAKTVVLMHREGFDDDHLSNLSSSLGLRILCLADMMNNSAPMPDKKLPKISRDDLATIVYTSGTTGRYVIFSHFILSLTLSFFEKAKVYYLRCTV